MVLPILQHTPAPQRLSFSISAAFRPRILLVDEAYYLYNAANDRDYGQESIEILLNIMENNKDDLVVAVAGYKDR